MEIALVYSGRIALPKLLDGKTTIYDAAMSLTGRRDAARHKVLGFDGDHAPTWPELREWILVNPDTYSVFVELLKRLQDRRLAAVNPRYYGHEQIDPFQTLISESAAEKIFHEIGLSSNTLNRSDPLLSSPNADGNDVGNEDACRSWLIKLMSASPTCATMSNADMLREARIKWPSISERAVVRAKASSVKTTDAVAWIQGGAPRKPPQVLA